MRKVLQFLWLLLPVLAGCTTLRPGEEAVALPPQPCIRIARPDTNTVQLQIAVRKLVPVGHRGPVILLGGTSHIGEPAYYRELQDMLNAQTVVLFEGVDADAHPRRAGQPRAANETPPPARKRSEDGFSMQAELAKSLGLVFQLDAIDYDRTNFFNSDLSIFEIQKLMLNDSNAVPAAPGEPGVSNPTFDALMQIMDGSSFLGWIMKTGIQFIGSSPSLQATTRYLLVEMLGGMNGDFSDLRGLPPDLQHLLQVLIDARNQKVVDDLKTESRRLPRNSSIAVFYGTGHMDNMEKRIVEQLRYRPDGDVWLTAFSVDLRKTGMSPGQLQSLRNLVRLQLEQMRGPSKPDPDRIKEHP